MTYKLIEKQFGTKKCHASWLSKEDADELLRDMNHLYPESEWWIEGDDSVENAKSFLKSRGYFVDNLWHVNDVKDAYECTDERAQEILMGALTNEHTVEEIQLAIKSFAKNDAMIVYDKINRQVIEDVITTALEGGSNYWYYLPTSSVKAIRNAVSRDEEPCLSSAFSKALLDRNVPIIITDAEDPAEEIGVASISTLEQRLGKLANDESYNWAFKAEMNEEGDAESSDIWFQYIVLGEVIYS